MDDMDDTSLAHDNAIYRDDCYCIGIWMYTLFPLWDKSGVLDSSFDFVLCTPDLSHAT